MNRELAIQLNFRVREVGQAVSAGLDSMDGVPKPKRRLVVAAIALVAVGVIGAAVTLVPRYGPKLLADWSTRAAAASISEDNGRLVLEPREPNGDLVVYLHGAGQSYAAALNDPETSTLTRALLDAGYTVAAADAEGNAWGSDASVAAYRDLIDSVGGESVYLVAESMGALAGAKLAADDDVAAWVAIYPVCDIASIDTPALVTQIEAVYPQGAPSPTSWPPVPVEVWASPSDTVVPFAANAASCAPAGSLTETSGDHGDSTNFDPQAVVELFRAH